MPRDGRVSVSRSRPSLKTSQMKSFGMKPFKTCQIEWISSIKATANQIADRAEPIGGKTWFHAASFRNRADVFDRDVHTF